MKSIEELLRNLARPDVLEFGLVTNRLPSVNVGGRFEPVDDQAPSTDTLLRMLATMGGARFVDSLSEKPVQWTTRLDGVGVIAVAAIMRKDVVQARFTVARRDPVARPSVPSPVARPAPAVVKPQPAPAPAPASTTTRDLSKSDEWDDDDDDEPTVQTLSPGGPPPAGIEAKPKLARPPEEAERPREEPPRAPERPRPPTPTPPEPEERTEERPLPRAAPVPVVPVEDDRDPVVEVEIGPAESVPPGLDVDGDGAEPTIAGQPTAEAERPRIEATAGIEAFLAIAVTAGATDLHVVAEAPARVRVAGELSPRTQPVPVDQVERLVREIVPPRMRETFDRSGACDFALDDAQHGRFRVNASRQRTGPMLAVRLVAQELPSLPEEVRTVVAAARGLVLVSGPPGHGKSTTVAALVDAIDAGEARSVFVIEDPIERVHVSRRGLVTQREIGTHARSWTSAVDEALASDADVVVLGDLRSDEAVHALLAACEAGRLVLAATNAPSPAKAVDRIVLRVPEKDRARARATLEGALRTVVGQRLAPNADGTKMQASFEVVSSPAARKG